MDGTAGETPAGGEMATKATKIELENRTRTVWLIEHPDGDVILGNSSDRIVKGERDTRYQPDPLQEIPKAKYDSFPAHSRKLIDSLVKRGDLQRRELAA